MDNFTEFELCFLLKNENAQIIKDSFEKIPINSKRSPNMIESDRSRVFHNNIFQSFLDKSLSH